MKDSNFLRPAQVMYIGAGEKYLTVGKTYEAYFIEYWQGTRNSLHVKDDSGAISDFHPLEDFEVLCDPDNVLNFHEAIVECRSHDYDDSLHGIKYGKSYKAIGRDRNGLYLVMDESMDCYFYPPECFVIIKDEFGILEDRSIYYSYR